MGVAITLGAGGRVATDWALPSAIRFEADDRVAAEARYETGRVLVTLVAAGLHRRRVRAAFGLSPGQLAAAERRAAGGRRRP
jgi:hypothetical protein